MEDTRCSEDACFDNVTLTAVSNICTPWCASHHQQWLQLFLETLFDEFEQIESSLPQDEADASTMNVLFEITDGNGGRDHEEVIYELKGREDLNSTTNRLYQKLRSLRSSSQSFNTEVHIEIIFHFSYIPDKAGSISNKFKGLLDKLWTIKAHAEPSLFEDSVYTFEMSFKMNEPNPGDFKAPSHADEELKEPDYDTEPNLLDTELRNLYARGGERTGIFTGRGAVQTTKIVENSIEFKTQLIIDASELLEDTENLEQSLALKYLGEYLQETYQWFRGWLGHRLRQAQYDNIHQLQAEFKLLHDEAYEVMVENPNRVFPLQSDSKQVEDLSRQWIGLCLSCYMTNPAIDMVFTLPPSQQQQEELFETITPDEDEESDLGIFPFVIFPALVNSKGVISKGMVMDNEL